jgi:hypothetical protein
VDYVISGDEASIDGEMSSREDGIVGDDVGPEQAIKAALENVWSGLHHHHDGDKEEESDEDPDEDEDNEGDGVEEDDSEFWNMYNDHENGLSALDMLGEEFERNAVAHGEVVYDNAHIPTHDPKHSGKINRM